MTKKRKNNKFSIRKLIYNDKYLIVSSIIAALAIWIVVSVNLSPETTKRITVPVTIDFSGTLAEQLGIEYFDSDQITVDVTVSCKKYLAKDIDESDINASLQTSIITSTGYHSVPIIVSAAEGAEFSITSYYPTTYQGYYDISEEKSFPIEVSFTNPDFAAEGYVAGITTLSSESVTVSGPRSYLRQVASVSAPVTLESNLAESKLVNLSLTAVDENGNKVDYIRINDKVTANVPVLKIKTLPVSVNYVNAPQNISSLVDISYSVEEVEAGVLESAGLTSLVLGDVDFSKIRSGRNEFVFNTADASGAIILDGTDKIVVTIVVPNDISAKRIAVSAKDIMVNAPEGYSTRVVSLPQDYVTVIGTEEALDNFDISGLVLNCDVTPAENRKIKTGTSKYNLSVSAKGSDSLWVFGQYTVNVNIQNE